MMVTQLAQMLTVNSTLQVAFNITTAFVRRCMFNTQNNSGGDVWRKYAVLMTPSYLKNENKYKAKGTNCVLYVRCLQEKVVSFPPQAVQRSEYQLVGVSRSCLEGIW